MPGDDVTTHAAGLEVGQRTSRPSTTALERTSRIGRMSSRVGLVWRGGGIRRIAVISALLCLLAAAEFTWEVFVDDDVVMLDEQIADGVLEARSEPMTDLMRSVTSLADTESIAALALACLGVALLRRQRRQALAVIIAVVGTAVIVVMLKELLGRERPLPPHNLTDLATNAYPSGHAAYAVAAWGAAAWLLTIGASRWARALSTLFAGVLAIAIGISRIYLGVHWGSDVVAGWAVGGLCLSAGVLFASTEALPLRRTLLTEASERGSSDRAHEELRDD